MSVGMTSHSAVEGRYPGFGVGEKRHRATARFSRACMNKQTIGCARGSRIGGFDESRIPNPEFRG